MISQLRRSLRVPMLIFLVAVGFVLASVAGIHRPVPDHEGSRGGQPAASHTPTPGSPEQLLEEHDCWTGPAPADMEGKVPGHVVVTRADGRTVYGGQRLVGKALGQLFAGEEHGLTVRGFCR